MRSKELGWFFTMILGAGSLYAQPSDQFRRHTSWKDGLFIGANYQTGTVTILTTNATATSVFQPGRNDMNVGANGLGFNIGYTGYFRDDQMFGMRYYAFLDWNGYGARYKSSPYGGGAYYGSNNMLAYGAAADFFYNFFQGAFYRDDISLDLGFYVGVAIAGNSWLMGVNGQNAMGLPAGAKPSVSAFQFLFDVGIRALVVGAHGIDLGFKIPTINHTYYSDSHYSITFRRTFAFYIGYSYHF
ncbi:Outer membrane protein Omp10 [Helicobacter suis]|uniref:Outer membrane protein HorC n=2 Tax=Helicobacter suis TaxID=104628 RepID=E7G3G1_9HELI|nr:outer membrane protein [Helicobacter suis]EFX42095.1 outer membrane protein HorC [Helicobacter suis HS5]BCD45720.1 Outer membrane protein Omp10 [Helicobacter suis]BCD48354.1 Outer membrane protein Omp10 [Helicobacter suis]BCD51878.1 Outer membrane protein Omp10 [Helicobacter suis]BCD69694.1 Outer membrane protein Omp10 [Helicobacter suis]